MVSTWMWLAACWVVVQGNCGVCPRDLANPFHQRQADAYNAMPQDWKAVQVSEGSGFLITRGQMGYGPNRCESLCHINTSGKPHCYMTTKASFEKPARKRYVPCVREAYEDHNRPCKDTPQWDSQRGMRCQIHQEGAKWKWGKTHFPICFATQHMCIPPRSP